MRAVKRAVAFHRDNATSDDKVDRYGCTDIEDAAMNPFPMEEILRPSLLRARHDAEHVFMLSVTPAQWWVLTLGIETTKSDVSTARGSQK